MRRLVILLSTIITGCATATGYHPMSATGGYQEARIDATTYLVSYLGNGFTTRANVQACLLFRCAELTRDSGFDYFVIQTNQTDTHRDEVVIPSRSTVRSSSTGASTGTKVSTTPAQALVITNYSNDARIRMFKGDKPVADPNAYSAREVIQFLGATVKPAP